MKQTEQLNLNTITYKEFKNLSNKKYNEIPVFFFFNKKQKIDALKKMGIKEKDLKEKVFLFQGGIILKSESHKIDEFYNWLCECEKKTHQREDYLYQLFYYELFNHEVQITRDYDYFLEQIGIELDTKLKIKAFEIAKKDHWEYCIKNDCF